MGDRSRIQIAFTSSLYLINNPGYDIFLHLLHNTFIFETQVLDKVLDRVLE